MRLPFQSSDTSNSKLKLGRTLLLSSAMPRGQDSHIKKSMNIDEESSTEDSSVIIDASPVTPVLHGRPNLIPTLSLPHPPSPLPTQRFDLRLEGKLARQQQAQDDSHSTMSRLYHKRSWSIDSADDSSDNFTLLGSSASLRSIASDFTCISKPQALKRDIHEAGSIQSTERIPEELAITFLAKSISSSSFDNSIDDDERDRIHDSSYDDTSATDACDDPNINVSNTVESNVCYSVHFGENETTKDMVMVQLRKTISWRDMTSIEKAAYWWSDTDMMSFKTQARRTISKTLRHSSDLIGHCIDRVYRDIRRFTIHTTNNEIVGSGVADGNDKDDDDDDAAAVVSEYHGMLINPANLTSSIEQWYRVGRSKIGLEKYLTTSKSRSRLSLDMRQTIIEMSKNDSPVNEMAATSMELSRSACLFARCHGHAIAMDVARMHEQ
jgi:hypothetical protein